VLVYKTIRFNLHSAFHYVFFYLYRIGLQPVLHQQVYHGIFTEVSTELERFTSVIQVVCYYEIVSRFGCIKLALEVCEDTSEEAFFGVRFALSAATTFDPISARLYRSTPTRYTN
jgi:hypothetical protein